MALAATPRLLTGDAAALDAELLAMHVAIASEVLGLVGGAYPDAELPTLGHALALQVSYQVEAFPAVVVLQEGAGPVSAQYRKAADGTLPPAHPFAVVLVAQVNARVAAAAEPPPAAAPGEFIIVRRLR